MQILVALMKAIFNFLEFTSVPKLRRNEIQFIYFEVCLAKIGEKVE